jgi:hypothetical protein
MKRRVILVVASRLGRCLNITSLRLNMNLPRKFCLRSSNYQQTQDSRVRREVALRKTYVNHSQKWNFQLYQCLILISLSPRPVVRQAFREFSRLCPSTYKPILEVLASNKSFKMKFWKKECSQKRKEGLEPLKSGVLYHESIQRQSKREQLLRKNWPPQSKSTCIQLTGNLKERHSTKW